MKRIWRVVIALAAAGGDGGARRRPAARTRRGDGAHARGHGRALAHQATSGPALAGAAPGPGGGSRPPRPCPRGLRRRKRPQHPRRSPRRREGESAPTVEQRAAALAAVRERLEDTFTQQGTDTPVERRGARGQPGKAGAALPDTSSLRSIECRARCAVSRRCTRTSSNTSSSSGAPSSSPAEPLWRGFTCLSSDPREGKLVTVASSIAKARRCRWPSRAAVTRFGYGPTSAFSVLSAPECACAPKTPIWARLLCGRPPLCSGWCRGGRKPLFSASLAAPEELQKKPARPRRPRQLPPRPRGGAARREPPVAPRQDDEPRSSSGAPRSTSSRTGLPGSGRPRRPGSWLARTGRPRSPPRSARTARDRGSRNAPVSIVPSMRPRENEDGPVRVRRCVPLFIERIDQQENESRTPPGRGSPGGVHGLPWGPEAAAMRTRYAGGARRSPRCRAMSSSLRAISMLECGGGEERSGAISRCTAARNPAPAAAGPCDAAPWRGRATQPAQDDDGEERRDPEARHKQQRDPGSPEARGNARSAPGRPAQGGARSRSGTAGRQARVEEGDARRPPRDRPAMKELGERDERSRARPRGRRRTGVGSCSPRAVATKASGLLSGSKYPPVCAAPPPDRLVRGEVPEEAEHREHAGRPRAPAVRARPGGTGPGELIGDPVRSPAERRLAAEEPDLEPERAQVSPGRHPSSR